MSQRAFRGVMVTKSSFPASSSKTRCALHAARGGLRLSFTTHPEGTPAPDLHAGDEVAVLTQAKRPQLFKDDGAFDRRASLAQQNIDLVATLRAPELIERISSPTATIGTFLARARRRLRDEIDELFAGTPQAAGLLRATLLGDRGFVDQTEAADFQKTGIFHVLVVAGLHVGALALALYWVGLTGVVVPLGFLTLACGLILPAAGKLLAAPLTWLTALLCTLFGGSRIFPVGVTGFPGHRPG